jgi:hypothetical protein
MSLLLLLLACGEAPKKVDRADTAEAWERPTFEGDGLPASPDTGHPRPSSSPENTDTASGGDTGEAELPSLIITDGLFTTFGGTFAYLVLSGSYVSCYDAIVGGAFPEGIYIQLQAGGEGDGGGFGGGGGGGDVDWAADYAACGEAPCWSAYEWVYQGESGALGPDATLSITDYDAHYLTVDWQSAVSSGEQLLFYNCGAYEDW